MSSFPYLALFTSSIFLSTVMVVSSSHLLMVWMALELNMISFIPLIAASSWFQEAEAAMKYFMFQALGSSLILLAAAHELTFMSLFLGATIKLGLAPFHFWFPQVMNSLNWPLCIMLSTWQKIAPLTLIISFMPKSLTPLLFLISAISALTGGLGGLGQTQMRPLMAYSSIGHMAWMLSASSISLSLSIIYFLLYIVISAPLFILFWLTNLFSNALHTKFSSIAPGILLIMITLLLSLGGLPPLTGFLPKWLVLTSLNFWPLVLALLAGSALNLFFYLNISLSLATSTSTPKTWSNSSFSLPLSLLILIALLSLPLSFYLLYALILLH